MCTVTIVQAGANLAAGFRMACSRDERHGRAPANPPERRTFNNVKALLPIDPASDGTWVAVNEHGLALTLLNYNLTKPPTGRDRSRGAVIPTLLSAASVEEALALAGPIERERMMPFRLVACDGRSVMLWRSTEAIGHAEIKPWAGEPVMFTSSGLGDHLVEPPRRALFERWFGDDATEHAEQQRALHQHRWPGRAHLSICMHRDDARTVSYTTVDVIRDGITMTYHPDRPDQPADDCTLTLTPRLAASE